MTISILTSILICPLPNTTIIERYTWTSLIGSFTYLGWEWWWSVGATINSTPYGKRFNEEFQGIDPTTPNKLHAVVLSIADGGICIWLLTIASWIVPHGLYSFDIFFVLCLIIGGVIQNVLVTMFPIFTPFQPTIDTLSWSPIGGNVTCPIYGDKICWSNQKIWVFVPISVYIAWLTYFQIKYQF